MQPSDEVLQSSLDEWEAKLSALGVDLEAVRASLARLNELYVEGKLQREHCDRKLAQLEAALERPGRPSGLLDLRAAREVLQDVPALWEERRKRSRLCLKQIGNIASAEITRWLTEQRVPLVPPAGIEPAHPTPEAGALSPELRGQLAEPSYRRGGGGRQGRAAGPWPRCRLRDGGTGSPPRRAPRRCRPTPRDPRSSARPSRRGGRSARRARAGSSPS